MIPTQNAAETLVPDTLIPNSFDNGTSIFEPGKQKSGFNRSSKVGPLLLKLEISKFFVRLPIVITF